MSRILADHPWRWVGIAMVAVAAVVLLASRDGRRGRDGPLGDATPWIAYGADPGGSRYSGLTQINRDNVRRLEVAWTVRTGDATHDQGDEGPREGCGRCHTGSSKFEGTPILAEGRLYLSTPLNRVLALDPRTGKELWRFDSKLKLGLERNEGFVSRGVAYWSGLAAAHPRAPSRCDTRIFFGTIDARLLSLDAATGAPCRDFGEGGTVRLDTGVGRVQEGQYGVTSPPSVVGNVVVVGSSIGDNRRVDMERGTVRGYDARNGRLIWRFDPVPLDTQTARTQGWPLAAAQRTGAGNAWAPLSADTGLGLVFVPTGSAAPDFYGGERPGDNRYTNSVVALEAATGTVRWHFQVVHHDLWDFDVAAQPTLVTVPRGGKEVPAVAVATKMGHIFILDRMTGEPLFPVEERPVPASDVQGERASPTQPFPVLPRPLFEAVLARDDIWGLTPAERAACLAEFDRMRSGPVFTPPSLEGTVMYPGYAGGTTWGGVSWSPERHLLVTNLMRIPLWVRLAPRDPGDDESNHLGTPYTMTRGMLSSPRGVPCNRPPWGSLVAIDLSTGEQKWQVPLGRVPEFDSIPESVNWGSANLGRGKLPAGGQATPMTYAVEGRQYVLIAAGGNGNLGTTFGDFVVAFRLQ
jgi:quinoprotein glucose dehydrogenase